MQLVRSIFLSDIHLGTKACQANHLLDFLKEYLSEYVFLLGDIIDFWSMSRGGVHWSAAQNTFVQKNATPVPARRKSHFHSGQP